MAIRLSKYEKLTGRTVEGEDISSLLEKRREERKRKQLEANKKYKEMNKRLKIVTYTTNIPESEKEGLKELCKILRDRQLDEFFAGNKYKPIFQTIANKLRYK